MKKLILFLGFLGSFSFSFGFTGDTTVLFEGGSITKEQKDLIEKEILSVLNQNYAGIQEYEGFDLAINDEINKQLTGKKNLNNFDLPDFLYTLNFQRVPSIETIKECIQGRINYLKSSGLPITPDRYLVRITEKDGRAFIVMALDETYIFQK
jgi:hypothetical protein